MTTEYPVEVSKYKSASGVAKKVAETLEELSDCQEITVLKPEDCERIYGYGEDLGMWAVMWEAGPYEWAINLAGGMSFAYGEFPSAGTTPEIVGFNESEHWQVEHHYSFDLLFIPK